MLTSLLRALCVALLASAGLVLATSAPAAACKCTVAELPEQAQDATAIFVATVDTVTPVGKRFEYAVTAEHSYKGEVDREVEVSSNQEQVACGLGELRTGRQYIFFVNRTAPPFSANSCGGTGPLTNDRVDDIETLLGEGTAIEPPPPPAPTMTKVEESAPLPLARLAAPGGALILLGVLGLLFVGRRRRA